MHSQTISTPRVQTLVNTKGDTIIQMSLSDAKIILVTVFDKQIADSLISVYETRDSLNSSTISLLKSEIDLYGSKINNLEHILLNNSQIIGNKDIELSLLNTTIKEQKKEIRKQKVLKIIGFAGSVVLPIATLLLLVL